jgi:adenosylmethionine-8-amino-7-oxononanoate aminotransferase
MAGTATGRSYSSSELSQTARRHLWMHFSRLAGERGAPVPVIVSGDGCYVYDADGKRYLDGLSALFCVNAGHGRVELAEAAAAQIRELGFYTNWSYAHPRSIELAERIAALAPGDLNRVFFTSGGSEAVESALKLARAYHGITGNPRKTKLIAREIAYHGTTLGRSPRPGSPSCGCRSSRSCPVAATSPTPTPTAGRRGALRSGPPMRSPSGSSSRAPRPSPR